MAQTQITQAELNAIQFPSPSFTSLQSAKKHLASLASNLTDFKGKVEISIDNITDLDSRTTSIEGSVLTLEGLIVSINQSLSDVNAILASDNLNLDTLQEVANAIEQNITDLQSLIVNNLTTNDATKALSAAQGKELYDYIQSLSSDIDTVNTTINSLQSDIGQLQANNSVMESNIDSLENRVSDVESSISSLSAPIEINNGNTIQFLSNNPINSVFQYKSISDGVVKINTAGATENFYGVFDNLHGYEVTFQDTAGDPLPLYSMNDPVNSYGSTVTVAGRLPFKHITENNGTFGKIFIG